MTTFTAQELFDKAYKGVVAQGKQAYHNGCKYRTADGLKCAIGFIIDDATAKIWDQIGALDEVKNSFYPEDLPDWFKEHFVLLESIQMVHDGAPTGDTFIKYFEEAMAGLADRFHLKVPA